MGSVGRPEPCSQLAVSTQCMPARRVWFAPGGVRIRRWPAQLASRAPAALDPAGRPVLTPSPAHRSTSCWASIGSPRFRACPSGRRGPAGDGNRALSVESLDPVLRHGAGWAGRRLVFGVVAGRDELRSGGVLVGLEVPAPVLARLEALHVAMVCRVEVGPCVLAGRGVAASDVTALGTPPEMEPPPGRLAWRAGRRG
jgi:hypothetical protein